MPQLRGKTCVIIGGAGLLGSAFAKTVASAGGTVIVADKDVKKGASLAKKINGYFEKIDMTTPASIERAAKRIQKRFKHIDSLVLTSYPRSPRYGKGVDEVSFEDFGQFLKDHVGGYFHSARTFASLMPRGASIVFLSSIYGVSAPKFEIYSKTSMTVPAEYAAAKGALVQLTKYLAAFYGKRGIRVNTISPGGIFANQPKSFIRAYSKHVRLGSGLLSPDDVCGALIFLLSDASSKMTGQILVVDGGWTL